MYRSSWPCLHSVAITVACLPSPGRLTATCYPQFELCQHFFFQKSSVFVQNAGKTHLAIRRGFDSWEVMLQCPNPYGIIWSYASAQQIEASKFDYITRSKRTSTLCPIVSTSRYPFNSQHEIIVMTTLPLERSKTGVLLCRSLNR